MFYAKQGLGNRPPQLESLAKQTVIHVAESKQTVCCRQSNDDNNNNIDNINNMHNNNNNSNDTI